MKRIGTLVLAALFALIALAGCTQVALPEDTVSDSLLEQAVAALESGDADTLYALYYPGLLDEAQFRAAFPTLTAYYDGSMESWEVVSRNTKSNTTSGRKTVQVQSVYRLHTDNGVFYITLQRMQDPDGEGIYNLHITNEQDAAAAGQSAQSQRRSPAQLVVTLYGVACQIFVIVTLINGIRTKLRKKPLMLLLNIVQIGPTLQMIAGEMKFTFNLRIISLLELSYLKLPGESGFVLYLLFPAGSLLYWLLRGRMRKQEPELPPVGPQSLTDAPVQDSTPHPTSLPELGTCAQQTTPPASPPPDEHRQADERPPEPADENYKAKEDPPCD